MALGFQSNAFQHPGFQGGAAVSARPYPAPAGRSKSKRTKRKPYVLDGQRLMLSPEELDDALEAMLEREAPEPVVAAPIAAPVKPKDRAIVAAVPSYPSVQAMLLAAHQIEAAQRLRAIAQRMADEEDERDVEALLLYE